jgi:hypothetical protein
MEKSFGPSQARCWEELNSLSSIVLLAPMNVHHDLPIDILPAGSSGVCGLQAHKDTTNMHAFKGMYLYCQSPPSRPLALTAAILTGPVYDFSI